MSGSRGLGVGTVVGVSAMTSTIVSVVLVLGLTGRLPFFADQEVPDVQGVSLEAARDMLEARGLRAVHRGERHDDDVQEGAVAEQQPRAGSLVPGGSEVSLIVSLGADLVEVPDVVGLTAAPARARLINAGLRVSSTTREGGAGSPGSVWSTTPAAGERVARDTEVLLTIVPEHEQVLVPDVVGQRTRAAREAIIAAGLVVGRETHGFDDIRAPWIILRQSPEAGTEVDPGSAVDIVINEE